MYTEAITKECQPLLAMHSLIKLHEDRRDHVQQSIADLPQTQLIANGTGCRVGK